MAIAASIEPVKSLVSGSRLRFSKADLLWFLPFVAMVTLPVFWGLTAIPVLQWDEARLAVNAAEMADNGNLIVTYFQGKPDMWNTKPPLLIWLQALSIKIFGYSELAIRFPTALAVLSTFGLLFWFGLKAFRSKLVAVVSVLVLVSSRGYMTYHVARNGDYDATLVLFITLYILAFFLYLEENKRRYWWLCIAGLTLAVLTKGIAGLMCTPALLVYILYRGRLLELLKQRTFYLGAAIFLVFTLGYYFLREQVNPGYLQAVFENELGGRYLNTLDEHKHPWFYYLKNMLREKYVFWLPVLLISVWILLWQQDQRIRRFAVLAVSYLVIFIFIISTAETKLLWYDAPVYSIAAILIALGLSLLLKSVSQFAGINFQAAFFTGSVLLICIMPYYQVLKHHQKAVKLSREMDWETLLGPALKTMVRKYPQEKQIVLFQKANEYPALSHFYKLAYGKKGYRFSEVDQHSISGLEPGQVVIVCDPELPLMLENRYETAVLHKYYASRVYRILEKKKTLTTNKS